ANGATVSGTIPVSASAADGVGVTKVVFAVNGVAKSTLTAAPWTFNLDTTGLPSGTNTIMATASDAANNSSSASIAVSVQNGVPDPPPAAPAPTAPVNAPAKRASVPVTGDVCHRAAH